MHSTGLNCVCWDGLRRLSHFQKDIRCRIKLCFAEGRARYSAALRHFATPPGRRAVNGHAATGSTASTKTPCNTVQGGIGTRDLHARGRINLPLPLSERIWFPFVGRENEFEMRMLTMMDGGMGGGMMLGMGLVWLLIVVVLILLAAALIKYLRR